jgi:hypothetical protein
MIELPEEVGSEKEIDRKKTVGNLKEETVEEKSNDMKVVQQKSLQANHRRNNDKKVLQRKSLQINHSQDNQLNQSSLQDNQLEQYDCSQFNQEIKFSYLKRTGIYYRLRWLHRNDRDPREINYYKQQFNIYNQLLEFHRTLQRSNFDVIEFCKTQIKIDVDNLPRIRVRKFPIRIFSEKHR